ncbi:efflux RND transporter permease subunit [Terrarubrum flagellatum]|uniref:efflux RND transporter permease subunit n=1 Tax=Terrirubrum flagellatum TaxID=2895980 RepID=UPI00314521D3
MNLCEPFVRRPVASTLLAIGLLLIGFVAYGQLPVSSLPTVDLPTIRVSASRPGADPETMASSVAAPLERRLATIAGVTEITSRSNLGSTTIAVQFDLARPIDKAAQDVQSAINASMTDLPSDIPTLPTFRKANPAAQPILILALTSQTIPTSGLYDAADTVLVQRLSQVQGVAEASVSGAEQPAVRVEVDPTAIAAAGFTLDQIRTAIVNANAMGPLGAFDGPHQAETIRLNAQMNGADAYKTLTLRGSNGTVVRLTDIAKVTQGVRNIRAAGTYDGRPAVLITITKAADANVVETVRRINALLPDLKRWIPEDIDVQVMSDRTVTLRASIVDMQKTLLLSIGMVMAIVFLFLGRTVPTLAAGVTIPLAFAGAFAGMWLAGFTIDNLSLMALAISVGFVVEDAIVVIESVIQRIEKGMPPLQAAIEGAGRIAFTVVAISLSLVAAFVPLFFMGGIVGKFFQEFSLTVAYAIAASTLVALSVTPMMCGQLLKAHPETGFSARLQDGMKHAIDWVAGLYVRSLKFALRASWVLLLVMAGTIGWTVHLFQTLPKGYFPQDDTGLLFGWAEASTDTSFEALKQLQERAAAIVSADHGVAHVGSFMGSSGWISGGNSGRLFVSLKPVDERKESVQRVIARLRNSLRSVTGLSVYLTPVQDVRAGGRQGKSDQQFTLWSADLNELRTWAPKVAERLRLIPGLTDVSTDQEAGGLQITLAIDRDAAARLGVSISAIDAALNNAFSQRQIVTIYAERNQYRVVMATSPRDYGDPSAIDKVFVTNSKNKQVPLSGLVRRETTLAPLVVNHQGQYPSITVTYTLQPDASLGQVTQEIRQAVAELHLPETLHADFAGDAAVFTRSANDQTVLIVAALITIYILLGILYESFVHPLTILSTLPSAGLGALLALQFAGVDLTLVALIGVILLIGIVKKNGIMLVDQALVARRAGASPRDAILSAAHDRFRPITMTTLAAMLGALPLLLGEGPGSELRRPLGITIVGGLFVSQLLTLYTTPAIYLAFDRLSERVNRWRGKAPSRVAAAPVPAE